MILILQLTQIKILLLFVQIKIKFKHGLLQLRKKQQELVGLHAPQLSEQIFQDNQINKISSTQDFKGLTFLQALVGQYVVASSNTEMRIYDMNLQKYETFSCSKPDRGLFFNPNDDLMISSCEGQITSNIWDKQLKTPTTEQYQYVTKHGYTSPLLTTFLKIVLGVLQQQLNSLVKYSVVGQKIVLIDQNSLNNQRIEQSFSGFDYLRYSENLILYDKQNNVYLLNPDNSFQWCNDTCLTCDDSDPTLCLTCRYSNMIVNQNSQCICKEGFFMNSKLLCQKCDPTCKTCKDQNTCLTCEETQFRVYNSKTNQCDCQQSYYSQNSSPTCIKCPYYCQNCAYDYSLNTIKCIQCFQNTQLNRNNVGNCECKSGFFDDGTNLKCNQCNYTCQECTSQNKCSSCDNSKLRYLNPSSSSSCGCKSGYYDDGENQLCQKCPYYCLECQKQENKIVCTSCNIYVNQIATFRQNDQTCSCQKGYYDQGQIFCKACNNGCTSCDQNGSCQANCPENCIFCNNSNQCNKCKPLTYLVNQQCQTQCKSNQYADDTKQTCEPCPSNCSKCNLDGKKCQQCYSDYVLYQGKCLVVCPDGTYKNQNDFCQECQQNCILCNTNGICNKCKDGFYLYLDKVCLANCPDGYYQDCDSGNVCNQCSEGFLLYQNKQCLLSCPKGNYKDSNNICRQCQKNCAQCDSTGICNQCFDSFYLFQNKYCLQFCPDGFFKSSSNTCQQCTSNCIQCDQIDNCNKCQDDYYLYQNNKCLLTCPGGSYKGSDNICQQCQANCKQCDSTEACNKCQDGFYLFQKKKCLDNCPIGNYKDSNNICQLCQQNCIQCNSKELCTQCQDGFFLFKNQQCLKDCPNNYYPENQSRACQKCMNNCDKCSSSNSCDQCVQNFYLLNNNSCLSECPQKYFKDSQKNICVLCFENCVKCSNTSSCLKCGNGLHLLDGQQCVQNCPDGYFEDYSLGICQICSTNFCQKCNNQNKCLECKSNYYLKEEECVQHCGQGFQIQKNKCIICKADNCLECNKQIDQCSSCLDGYELFKNVCVAKCETNQIRDQNGRCFEQNLFKLEQKSKNSIKVLFKFKHHFEDVKKELQVTIQNLQGEFDYIIEVQDDLTLLITLTTSKKLQEKQTVTVEINNTNNEFAYQTQSIDIQLIQQKQDENPVASKSIETAAQAVSSATVAAIFPLAISGNFWMISSILDISQIIYMTSFIEFEMTSTLDTFLSSQKNFKIPFPNFFEYFDHYEDITYPTPSQIFEKDIQGFYLSNMGDTISLLAIIFGLYLSLKMLKVLLLKCEKAQKTFFGQSTKI
ncbi:hypothetical protein TTHERM_000344108 (macronuclear) [Tetrahymena thermophila SB210]|uniref:EGF-like domain-containing protein n=1 Tax=Tetrahymena thermophila (strain SB210) TaxID=312017 RepID=W7XHG6_TETTS|nr:hypothetical protein TTHERM_000344108 [Tetrahymena thermophila SB210]EWS73791.1 hypothetical protein TTHERM_000344108 [Tetrahymena thermophila SB210]|eukprot:XP_012653671.1 hypothetical protein TTHERM_000344108 [Tetrahymena thermophila SB210]